MTITRLWTVTATLKAAGYGSQGRDRGAEFTIAAKTAKDAISLARKRVAYEGLYDRHDGPLAYRAQIAE